MDISIHVELIKNYLQSDRTRNILNYLCCCYLQCTFKDVAYHLNTNGDLKRCPDWIPKVSDTFKPLLLSLKSERKKVLLFFLCNL